MGRAASPIGYALAGASGGDRRTDGTLEAVADGDMTGRVICEKRRHGERRGTPDAALIGGANRLWRLLQSL